MILFTLKTCQHIFQFLNQLLEALAVINLFVIFTISYKFCCFLLYTFVVLIGWFAVSSNFNLWNMKSVICSDIEKRPGQFNLHILSVFYLISERKQQNQHTIRVYTMVIIISSTLAYDDPYYIRCVLMSFNII